ncbi:ATP-binding cassette, subfamily G (WHITE), member 2, PDR, partial [Phenoliferia sp. Uapishka_3]
MSSIVSDTTAAPSVAPSHEGKKHGGADRDSNASPFPYAEEVHDIARRLSRVSTLHRSQSRIASHLGDHGDIEMSPFDEDNDDKRLDPNSPEFDVHVWIKALLNVQSRQPELYPARSAGVSFSDLAVYGFGSSTDYQKTVLNSPFSLISTALRYFGIGKKLDKIQILRGFEGLVESGEMLIVLGRPGSGCSTFLKCLAGETYGFHIEPTSNLQYQGVPAKVMHKDFRGEVIYNAETDIHFPLLTVGETLGFAARARAPRNRIPGVSRELYAEVMRDVVMAVYGLSHTRNTKVGNDFIRGVSGGERKRVSIAECTLSGSPFQCWDNRQATNTYRIIKHITDIKVSFNSTRGLDSASALQFVKTLRLGTQNVSSTAAVAIYQASQNAYDVFDKVIVLYAGYEIYFGRCDAAKEFFTSRGYICPPRQITADFLTSLTNPAERVVAPGWESRVPRTPEQFAQVWKESPERAQLLLDIKAYEEKYPDGGERLQAFKEARSMAQAKHMSSKDPYTISIPMQVKLCMSRGFQRLKADSANTIITVVGMWCMSLIVASIFYNLKPNTASFFSRGALIFFSILMNALASALEILTLVEKHKQFAFYHPFTEAISSMMCDLPAKIMTSISFNLTIYFMTNLRREPGPFFFFLLISFTTTLVMSSVFRTIAAVSKTLQQALAPAAVFILILVTYTGFGPLIFDFTSALLLTVNFYAALPITSMHGWSRWLNYLDPIAFAFESLMVNEFHGRSFPCSAFVPSGASYGNVSGTERSCSTVGSVAGSNSVSGDLYLSESFQYYHSHKWRNFGIMIAFWVTHRLSSGFTAIYLLATEFIAAAKSKGEVLVFRQGHAPKHLQNSEEDEESGATEVQTRQDNSDPNEKINIHRQTATFHWEDVCYDIKIKSEERRILSNVDGWVKPGTLTALMGASGAGKTTLLDVLANRVTMGVITGNILVDGQQRDGSFQRKTGYCMQQDLHLSTATVRESLSFSALCRQLSTTPRAEKLAYVEEVIKILEMEDYADAVVGVPGEGLNVEQRKRLTIGVELAAKPDLLLFLDEPSSGLDSQTAWSMVRLCRKLANSGQAILCTIHQPSAILMAEFDREHSSFHLMLPLLTLSAGLLFLAKGGRTVYFGDVGPNCSTLVNYFEANGAEPCDPAANPAEWMLELQNLYFILRLNLLTLYSKAAPGSKATQDWHATWRGSVEYEKVHVELSDMKAHKGLSKEDASDSTSSFISSNEFAIGLPEQLWWCFWRVWAQYWRTPSYIFSKTALCTASSLFVGFSFYRESNTAQGLQNEMFSIFMLLTIFGICEAGVLFKFMCCYSQHRMRLVCQQIMPLFCTQRALYEARERPSKTYAWQAFLAAQILVEIPWQTLSTYSSPSFMASGWITDKNFDEVAVITYFCWYYPIGLQRNAVEAGAVTERGGLMFLLVWTFYIFTSTFAHMVIAAIEVADVGGTLATFVFMLPHFWIFLYRVSPFTYLVSAMLTTGVSGATLHCSTAELVTLTPPAGQTCQQYLSDYLIATGASLYGDTTSATSCSLCTASTSDAYLAQLSMSFSDAWRNFGLMFAYIVFNIGGAVLLYWLARVPKKAGPKIVKKE